MALNQTKSSKGSSRSTHIWLVRHAVAIGLLCMVAGLIVSIVLPVTAPNNVSNRELVTIGVIAACLTNMVVAYVYMKVFMDYVLLDFWDSIQWHGRIAMFCFWMVIGFIANIRPHISQPIRA